jgi:hypothetical protein
MLRSLVGRALPDIVKSTAGRARPTLVKFCLVVT